MSERNNKQAPIKIEDKFSEVLCGDSLKNALDFAAFLHANTMQYDGMQVTYDDKCVCYIHIDGAEQMPGPWTVWPEGDYCEECEAVPMDEHMKEIAWKNIDICANCGGCKNPGGTHKKIFGKEFDNVCITAMRFNNPDAEAIECAKKMVEIRKKEIQNNSL